MIMKTMKNMIILLFAASVMFGNMIPVFGQQETIFYGTYTYGEISGLIPEGHPLWKYLDREGCLPEGALLGTCKQDNSELLLQQLNDESIKKLLPEDLLFAFGKGPAGDSRTLFTLKEKGVSPAPGRKDIRSVELKENTGSGTFDLLLTFSGEGAGKWERMTGENVGRDIAILVDGQVVSAPKVMEPIKGGKCMISGNLSKEEASALKASLEH
jgi:SecD/SecF fusion protein